MRNHLMCAITAAAVAAVTLVAPATPAQATITGTIDFVCTAHMPLYPVFDRGTCGSDGLVPSSAIVTASGVDTTGHTYVVTGMGSFYATYSYSPGCTAPLPLLPPVEAAFGSASVTGLTAAHERVVLGARLDTNFSWVRVGLVAVILTANTRVTFSNGHVAVAIMNDFGTASFAPLPGSASCASPAPARAVVAGTDYVPA